jgi:uncharacterized RDD family membrane protein YckC
MNDDIDLLLNREGLKLSTIQSRAAALGIDEILLSVVLEYMTIKIIYQTFFTMQYGATLGKIVMKIRVVEVKTLSNPTLLSAFNRSIFRIASELVLYFGFIWGMLDPYKRTWHDFTARTLVVDV